MPHTRIRVQLEIQCSCSLYRCNWSASGKRTHYSGSVPSSTTPTLQTSASFLRHDVTSSLWLLCAHNHTHSTCTPDSIKINRIERGRLEWTLLIPSTAIQFVHVFSRARNDSCLNLSEGFVLYNAVSKTGSREEICQSFNERCFCSSFSSGNEKMGPWGLTNMTVPFPKFPSLPPFLLFLPRLSIC